MPYKTYLTNKKHSTKFRVNGLVPSARLPHKSHLCQTFRGHIVYRAEHLPPKVDLRSHMSPVEDQSQIGSCAANTLVGAYEYLTKKANGRNTDVSRLFIYYNARVKGNNSNIVDDSGCTMTSAIEALEEFGTCLESHWPYDISRVNTRPNESAYQEAKHHKITEALRIDINLHEMKSCLAQGYPFAFGLKLYTSFDQASRTGVVPMPNTSDSGRQSHGSHAMLAVGYSDQSNAFIVRNSWGENWGDKGYCYIPYQYLTNPNLCFDVWTVRKVATDSFGQEHWDNYDTVNYTHGHHHHDHHNHFDDPHCFIEGFDEDDDDFNQRNGFDNSWSSRNDFNNPWNQYQVHGGGNNHSEHHHQQHHDQQHHQQHYDQQHHHQHHERHDRHPGNGNFHHNQFRNEDNFSGFRGGYSDFDQFINNAPDFNNQFPPPPRPAFQPYQQYGQDYGYSSPFDNFFNPFF